MNDSEMKKLFEIQREAINTGNWEPLRMFYKPTKIKFILIGEAPPNGGDRFFYYDNVTEYDNLFLSVMSVLYPREASAYKSQKNAELKRELLNRFKKDGGFLMDLYPFPKNKKPAGQGAQFYIKDFFQRFANLNESILDENNEIDMDVKIIVVHSNATALLPYFKKGGFNCFQLPFPLYGYQEQFKNGLRDIIKEITNG